MSPRSQKVSRRQRAGLILSFGMVVLALGGVVGALLKEPAPRSSTTTTIPPTTTTLPDVSDMGEAGAELQRLIELSAGVSFHGVYDVEDPSLPDGITQSFEIWRDGFKARTDIIERSGTTRAVTRSVTNGSQSISCRTVEGYEECDPTDASPVIDLTALFVKAITAEDPPPKLTTRDETIGAFGELCLASDGVLLSTILEGAEITVARLDERFEEDTFDVTIPNRRVPTTTSTTTAVEATQPTG